MEVDEDLSTMMEKNSRKHGRSRSLKTRHQQKRGLAGAVMCETCDVKWYTLMFGKHQKVDMRICVPTRREENASDTRKDCFECEELQEEFC